MFGYIRTFNPELRVRELGQYRAVYCGLCHALGRRYGPLARFTLNYDMTFLALLRLTAKETCPTFERKRCPRHPLKKQACACGGEALDEAADACVIFFYYKLLDTMADARGFKRFSAMLTRPAAALWRRKAARRAPETEQLAETYFHAQRDAERRKTPVLDEVADPTARMLSALLARDAEGGAERRVLGRLGYFLGRYIYLMDAVDDLSDDLAAGVYNPFAAAFSPQTGQNIKDAMDTARELLNACRYEIGAAAALLPNGAFDGVLWNIFTFGLERMQRQVFEKKGGRAEGKEESV